VFLEVKLDNFLTREGRNHSRASLVINTHELICLYASQRMAQDVQQHVYRAALSCCNQNIVDGPLISAFDSDSSGSFDAFKKHSSQFIWCPVSIGCSGPGADLLRLVVVQQECRRVVSVFPCNLTHFLEYCSWSCLQEAQASRTRDTCRGFRNLSGWIRLTEHEYYGRWQSSPVEPIVQSKELWSLNSFCETMQSCYKRRMILPSVDSALIVGAPRLPQRSESFSEVGGPGTQLTRSKFFVSTVRVSFH